MGDVLTVLPFQNTLATFRIDGATLLAALENGVSQIEAGAGRFPQVAGMRFAVDITAPAGERIRDVMMGSAPLDPDRLYSVVSNNFLRAGGDGYAMLVEAQDAYDFGPDVADVVVEYLVQNAPYRPYTDGRIRLALD
jgi:5'-nucleotidase